MGLRLTVAGTLAVLAGLLVGSAGAAGGDRDCTSRLFRKVAERSYQPWYRPVGGIEKLTHLKACAPNGATRKNMIRIQVNLRAGRHKAIDNYRELTPYKGGGDRWAIPYSIVACESGGSWKVANSSGAIGPYQLLGHGAPWPVQSWHHRMQHHRIAGNLWAGGAGRGAWAACL